MKVGDIEIAPVLDSSVQVDPVLLFPRSAEQWEAHRQYLDAQGKLTLDFGSFLVRSGERVILVDLGIGGGKLLDSLAAVGLNPADVTDVVFTHLHFDHIGWASDGAGATFPNATYHCDQRDWDFFVGPEAAFTGHGPQDPSPQIIRDKMAAIESRVRTWSSDATIAPGVSVRRTPGHTPGSSIVIVSSGEHRAMMLGDICHCPAELVEDEWAALVDVDGKLAQRTRDALARELEGSGVAVSAAHFPGMRFGRVISGTGDRSWAFAVPSPS